MSERTINNIIPAPPLDLDSDHDLEVLSNRVERDFNALRLGYHPGSYRPDTVDAEGDPDAQFRQLSGVDYDFSAEFGQIPYGKITFHINLNQNRARYAAQAVALQVASQSNPLPRRSLLPHMPPPGQATCPFDMLGSSPLLVQSLQSMGVEYWLAMASRPWSWNHMMLVTSKPEPQHANKGGIIAVYRILSILGEAYEACFNGCNASASVYHFHFHIHKGSAAIWDNIDRSAISQEILVAQRPLVSFVVGWPSSPLLFKAHDVEAAATSVADKLEVFTNLRNDIPYNLLLRLSNGRPQILLFLRSPSGERPNPPTNIDLQWGRFGMSEMGGTITLLRDEHFRLLLNHPDAGRTIATAIREMSLSSDDIRRIIQEA